MLGVVGTFMFFESLNALRKAKSPAHAAAKSAPVAEKKKGFFASLPLQTYFEKSGVTHSALVPIVLGVFVGILAAIMGVGGGFIMVPMMVYLLRMPAHVAVGTSLFQALFTCAGATVMQAGDNQIVDVVLALLVAVGSTIGAQLGARLSRHLRGEQLMILLGVLALGVMVKMMADIVLSPAVPISQIAKLNFANPLQHTAVWCAFRFGR
jgi:uncharacterized membrane protein YfcA